MEFKVDPKLDKFLSKGLDAGVRRGLQRSLKETRAHVVSQSVKSLKASKFLSAAVTNKSIKNSVFSELADTYCTVQFSPARQSLWRVPFKTTLVRHPLRKGLKLTKIQTNIGGVGYHDDPFKPFWVRGKGQPVVKPNARQKPLALYRVGSARTPLKKATAPSISAMVQETGLSITLQTKGNEYLIDRVKRNVEYFLDQLPT